MAHLEQAKTKSQKRFYHSVIYLCLFICIVLQGLAHSMIWNSEYISDIVEIQIILSFFFTTIFYLPLFVLTWVVAWYKKWPLHELTTDSPKQTGSYFVFWYLVVSIDIQSERAILCWFRSQSCLFCPTLSYYFTQFILSSVFWIGYFYSDCFLYFCFAFIISLAYCFRGFLCFGWI